MPAKANPKNRNHYGTEVERAAYAGPKAPGDTFTTEAGIFGWDGTAWRGGGGAPSIVVVPTGIAAKDVPAIRAALAEMTGVGSVILGAGTFAIGPFNADTGAIEIPSNTRMVGQGPGVTKFACSGGQPFTCNQLNNITCQGTVGTANVVNAETISIAVVSGALVVDQPIEIRGAVPRNFQGAAYLIRAVAGVGPFTVTLDRPIVWTFQAGDQVTCYATQGHNIYLGGFSMTGTSTARAIELLEVRDSVVENVVIHDFVAASDRLVSFDSFSFNCTFRDVEIYNCGNINALVCEQNERALLDHCYVHDMGPREGICLTDNADSVVRNCKVSNCGAEGLLLSGEVVASNSCLRVRVEGGTYIGNADGIKALNCRDVYISSSAASNGTSTTHANCYLGQGTTGFVEGAFTNSPAACGVFNNASIVQFGWIDASECLVGFSNSGTCTIDCLVYDGPAVDGCQAYFDNNASGPAFIKSMRVTNSHGNYVYGVFQAGSGEVTVENFFMSGGSGANSRLIAPDTGIIWLANGKFGAALADIYNPNGAQVRIGGNVERADGSVIPPDSVRSAWAATLAGLVRSLGANALAVVDAALGPTFTVNGVSKLADNSGRGHAAYDLVQPTNVNKPAYIQVGIGNLPSLQTDPSGTGSFLDSGVVNITFPCTVYIVCFGAQDAGAGRIVDMSSGGGRAIVWLDAAHAIHMYAGNTLTGTKDVTSGGHLFCAVFNGATSALYVDDMTTPILAGDAGASAACTNIHMFAASGGPANPLVGQFSFQLIVAGAETAQQRAVIAELVAAHWGIAVA